MSADHIVYVRCMFVISATAFTRELEGFGFANAFEGGTQADNLMRVTCTYICVNVTKKCYVLCSHSYKNPTINSDEFKEKYKGLLSGNKFGL